MKKYAVVIYCKIYTDTYDSLEGDYTGDEIVEHLISPSNHASDFKGRPITGDLNIWYLGSNEKFGSMHIEIDSENRLEINWGFGESSYDNVDKFVDYLSDYNVITQNQYEILKEKIQEGRQIGYMYDIGKYLFLKNIGLPWLNMKTLEGFYNR